MTQWPARLVLIGAGKMGGAMAQGWLDAGLPAASLTIVEPNPSAEIASLAASRGVALNPRVEAAPDVLVLAVKPQSLDQVAPQIAALAAERTLAAVDHRGQDHRQSDGAAPSGARCRAGDAQHAGRDRPRGHGGFRQRGRQSGAAALVRAPARRGRRVLLARGRGRDRRRDRHLRLRPGLRVRPDRGAGRSGARDWACRRSSRWASRGAPSRARRN